MSLPRGTSHSLSSMRRTMYDFLTFSQKVPLVSMERRMHLRELVAVRQQLHDRPSWFALFVKAYALAARDVAEVRQSFLTFPLLRIHQHACSVASITIVRRQDNEDAVFLLQIREPDTLPVEAIHERIRHSRTAPLEKLKGFGRQLLLGRFPTIIRQFIWWLGLRTRGHWHAKYFGTFGITGVAALGSTSLHIISPLTSTLAYGVLEPDGSLMVRLYYDHRIMDGVQPALAMQLLEEHLVGSIKNELEALLAKQGKTSIRLAA